MVLVQKFLLVLASAAEATSAPHTSAILSGSPIARVRTALLAVSSNSYASHLQPIKWTNSTTRVSVSMSDGMALTLQADSSQDPHGQVCLKGRPFAGTGQVNLCSEGPGLYGFHIDICTFPAPQGWDLEVSSLAFSTSLWPSADYRGPLTPDEGGWVRPVVLTSFGSLSIGSNTLIAGNVLICCNTTFIQFIDYDFRNISKPWSEVNLTITVEAKADQESLGPMGIEIGVGGFCPDNNKWESRAVSDVTGRTSLDVGHDITSHWSSHGRIYWGIRQNLEKSDFPSWVPAIVTGYYIILNVN